MHPGVALPLVVLAMSGCVRAVPGTAVFVPAPDAERYAVSVGPPSGALPGGVAGSLDSVHDTGTTLTLLGWAPAAQGALEVRTDAPLQLRSQRRLERPDAAQALGRSGQPALGFRLVFDKPAGPAGLCVLFRAPSAPPVQLAAVGPTGCAR